MKPPSAPRDRFAPPRAAGAMALAALLACADSPLPERHAPATVRRFAPAPWNTVWRRGGAVEDTLLLMPIAVAADSARAYVLDAAGHRVVAFDAATGAPAWHTAGKGGGPGELASPVAIAAARGGVVVADPGNARLTFLDATGLVTQEVTVADVASSRSLCPLADGTLLLATGEDRPLALIRADGGVERRLPLPWPELADLPSLARQLRLAPTAGGRACVAALELGHGFAMVADERVVWRRPYVEAFPLPRVQVTRSLRTRTQRLAERQIAAYDVAVAGDEITMAFEGRSRAARRLLDVYSASTGAYLRSHELDFPVNAIALAAGRAFVLSERDGYPTLTAYATTTPTAAVP